MSKLLGLMCGVAALLVAGAASASKEWVLGSTPPVGVSVAGYANTGGTGTAANQTIQAATSITWYTGGGWGIKNADACSTTGCDYNEGVDPEHSIDNNGRYDMMLLSFTGGAVDLDQVKMGWTKNDSDITVMAYTSSTPFNLANNLIGKTYMQLLTSGWSAIGNYLTVGTAITSVNAGNQTSSYWLIGAYNPLAFSGPSGTTMDKSYDSKYDYVKLASVFTAEPQPDPSAPEPGTLALFGAALLGMIGLRRRIQA